MAYIFFGNFPEIAAPHIIKTYPLTIKKPDYPH
jgi:hypothetical protein